MKATDLRIGNYVNYLGEVQEVTGIDSEYVYLDTITFDYVEHDEIEPIPITEEWLLKLGFEPEEEDSAYYFSEECEYLQVVNYVDGFVFEKENTELVSLNYIHELQNLYHAITGNELEIKE